MFKFINDFQSKLYIPNVDFKNYKTLIALLLLLASSIFVNLGPRIIEKNIWEEFPSVFSIENEPLVRSGDPAFFIKIAKYLKEGIPVNDYYNKLNFPLKGIVLETDIPLLSHIISYLAKDGTTKEIVKAGNNFIFYSSVLTTVSVFFFFLVIGRPFEGIIASVGSGISSVYLSRSSYGYIDTDMLNLFFMYLLYAFIYLSSRHQSWFRTFCFIIAAGFVGKIFFLWYSKPELILLSFFSLVYFTIVNTKNWKKVFVTSFIYILCTNPSTYLNSINIFINNPYLSGYLSANIQVVDLVNNSSLNFNNIFRYIGELQKPSFFDLLKIEGSIYLGLLCFTGIILWAASYPLLFIGLAPLVFFFLLSFILGNRALFYSAPFVWFGLAYFTNFLTFKYSVFKEIRSKNLVYTSTSILLIFLSVFLTNSFNKKIDPTWISSKTIKGLKELGKIVEDKNNSVLVADWGYGYQSILSNDIPVLIHPGVPTSPRHYFIARALTSFDEEETLKIINYVVGGNVEKIKDKGINSFVELSKDIYTKNPPEQDIYFMVTGKQRRWMPSTGATAYWDIEKNSPFFFGDKTAYDVFNILEINCDDLDTTTYTTKCADSEGDTIKNIPVNLALGLWNGEPVIKRIVQVENGKVTINQEYKDAKGNFVFQIIKNLDDNTSYLYLMHEAVFKSTYNRLLHLNQFENYELVYEDYPYVKIYKIIN